jgi:hypothetical protein
LPATTIVSLEGIPREYLKKLRFVVSLITDENQYQRRQAAAA